MSGPRKFYRPGDVVFITTSVEKGLMLPPNSLVRTMLLSCLARAQSRYYLEICHIIVEATHIHIIAVVHYPPDVAECMRYFKAESAHALNRLLGWSKNTIWCEGYDSPVLLLPEDVRKKITYLYAQPSKDGLAESIERYAGLNSWRLFMKGSKQGHSIDAVCIARDEYPYIGHLKDLSEENYRAITRKLRKDKPKVFLKLNPDGWRKAFSYLTDKQVSEVNQKAVDVLRKEEAEHSATRALEGKAVIPRKRQVETPIGASYKPKRVGRRMRCHCSDKGVRKQFLAYTSWLIGKAKKVYQRWKVGDYSIPFPVGLFPPSRPRVVEPIVPILREVSHFA